MSEFDLESVRTAVKPFLGLGRSGLLPALHAAQAVHGWLPEAVAAEVAVKLRVPLADVHGVIEFYSLFYNQPAGKRKLRVCTDVACGLKGSESILSSLNNRSAPVPASLDSDGSTAAESSPCLGLCEHAPAGLLDDQVYLPGRGRDGLATLDRPETLVSGSMRLLTANCGHGTTSLAAYGRYEGLDRALQMLPAQVVAEVKASGLVGRGGAAFPTGVKWEGASVAAGSPKYVVCNADESEPGTFKDRVLMLDDPHRLLEGMLIAAYAIGAVRGYIYLRGEYPYVLPVLESALQEARSAGLIGGDFDIEIRVGAGAYICGEETALFESIEGKRGFPRIKPPFPTTAGLFGKPTVVNNVETLCNVPMILASGAASFRLVGTEASPGPKLFCLSGDVTRPGLYEVPFGTTLRELLSMAGGVAGGRSLQALLFGGAAGAFATAENLDVRLSFEDLRAAGLPLGSGVLVVFDETRDVRDTLKRLGRFFAHESCGKCYPCQMGTQRQMEILDRIAMGQTLAGDLNRLHDVGWTMTDASLCGLGQTAATAVLSATRLWPELFQPSLALPPPAGGPTDGSPSRTVETKPLKPSLENRPAKKSAPKRRK